MSTSPGGSENLQTKLDNTDTQVNSLKTQTSSNATSIAATASELKTQKARIDAIASLDEGSTTGDAELIDARVDSEGIIFNSIGDHLRFYDKLEKTPKRYLLKDLYGKVDNFLTINYYIRYATGELINYYQASDQLYASDYIEIGSNNFIILGNVIRKSHSDMRGLAFYDYSKTYISGIAYNSEDYLYNERDYKKIAIPENAEYVRITVDNTSALSDYKEAWIAFENESDALNSLNFNFPEIYGEDFWSKYNNDWNNLPNNKIFTVWGTDSTTQASLNRPPNINGGGIVITIKQPNLAHLKTIGDFQMFLNRETGVIYSRFYWFSQDPKWTEWTTSADSIMLLKGLGSTIQTNRWEQYDYDLNNFPINTFAVIENPPGTSIANMPNNGYFSGVIIDLAGVKNEPNLGRLQIAYNLRNTEENYKGYGIYYRIWWGGGLYNKTWTPWRQIPTVDQLETVIKERITNKPQLWKTFRKVGCIGDSLASGEVTGVGDLYDRSWGQYMASASGGTYYNFSRGGLEAGTWLTDNMGAPLAFDGEHKCQVYIIGLGVNDRGRGRTLGTIADVNVEDYSQNPDTYYGNMGKIIMMCQEHCPGSKIFILTNPKVSATDNWNVALKELVDTFDYCYLVDLATNYASDYASGGMLQNLSWSGHYPSIAYYRMSEIIEEAINDVVIENYMDFQYLDSLKY